jgi:hypothetical protein
MQVGSSGWKYSEDSLENVAAMKISLIGVYSLSHG